MVDSQSQIIVITNGSSFLMTMLKLSKVKSLLTLKPQMLIASDASMKSWGVFCWENETGTMAKLRKRINVHELKAAKFAILTFTKMYPDVKVVHLQMDNMVGLSYIKKMGLNTTRFFQD